MITIVITCCALAGIALITFLIVYAVRAGGRAQAAEKQLAETISNVEVLYSEVNNTQEELNTKYREIKNSEERIRKLAYEDAMTGLPNRTALMEVLQTTLDTMRRDERSAVMYIDIDNFKKVTDLLGHAGGDEIMLDISHRMRQVLDENDYLAKDASDEFFVLTQNIESGDLYEEKVKRLMRAMDFPFSSATYEYQITLSIGIVMADTTMKKADSVIRYAEEALAEAKLAGKNTYVYFTDALQERRLKEMELRASVNLAIRSEDFLVRYEPVTDLNTGEILAIRLKLLWDRGEMGIWQARRFISFAEETGQIIGISDKVFSLAVADARSLRDRGIRQQLIIPVTARILNHPNFETKVSQTLAEHDLTLDDITFEIPEEMFLTGQRELVTQIRDLSGRGYRIRLGDFGRSGMMLHLLSEIDFKSVQIDMESVAEHFPETMPLLIRELTALIRGEGMKVIYGNMSDSIEEDAAKAAHLASGEDCPLLVEGELYGEYLSAEELAEIAERKG